jgi:hypothetical protein
MDQLALRLSPQTITELQATARECRELGAAAESLLWSLDAGVPNQPPASPPASSPPVARPPRTYHTVEEPP